MIRTLHNVLPIDFFVCHFQTAKRTYVQLDCSQSVNCIPSRESAVHVVEVAANSNAVSWLEL